MNETISTIGITDAAKNELEKIKDIENIPKEHGLRVAVKGGGCSGLTYNLSFDEEKEGDTTVDLTGFKVFVDGKSLFYLMGTELDFSSGLNGTGFVFNNPNANKTCGCGESFGI